MRRVRRIIVPVLVALLLVVSNLVQNILAPEAWKRFEKVPFVQKWAIEIQIGLVVLFTVIYVLWDIWRTRDTAEEPGDHPFQMRQRLMNRVLEFAQAQFDGGLYAKARKEFHLAERPLHVTTEDRTMNVAIEPYYRGLHRPLVILGEPGTGKTTLLHELATLLCNPNDAIPVPFSLSKWALNEGPLAEWMVSELRLNYGVRSQLAKSWVSKEVVVPFLDGLDEVAAAKRAACVGRINEYRAAHPGVKFVVTCREAEYSELKTAIDVPSAVVVQTLGRAEVTAFLESNAPKFDGLRQALQAEPSLWEIMDTPLMLWVAAFAFGQGSGLDLTDGKPLRERLFDRYVDAMLKRDRGQDEGRFPNPVAKFWLHQTAACMTRAGVFSFHLEDLSRQWLPEANRAGALWVMRIVGLVVGLAGGLVVGLVFGSVVGLFVGLGVGLLVGRVVGLAADDADPVDAISWNRDGLFVGLGVGLFGGLFGKLGGGLLVGLIVGLIVGLVPSSIQERTSVNSGLKQSAIYAAAVALPFLLVAAWARLGEVDARGLGRIGTYLRALQRRHSIVPERRRLLYQKPRDALHAGAREIHSVAL